MSLGELKSLERLELARIEEPFELPISFGRSTGLQYLSISGCKVTSIPASFRNLTSLRFLMVEEMIDRDGSHCPKLETLGKRQFP
ncbi:hypothetical protein R1flu_003810 [Riccia fluitans]|uniref:Disease resistance protein n=1 Tax=Riccia fluitans TaxID=41844 RepID=A0ABD1YA69_9MARC